MTPQRALLARMEEALPDHADQMYMLIGPQDPPLPVAVVQTISRVPLYHMRGENRSSQARVQVKVYAGTSSGDDRYEQAADFADLIHGDGAGSVLSGFRGWVGGSPDQVFVEMIKAVDGPRDLFEPDELQLVGLILDYFVYYRGLSSLVTL